MNKISKALKAFGLILKKPYLLNLILNDESTQRDEVLKQFPIPNGLPMLHIDELFPDFQEVADPYAYLSGATMPIDIALLRALAKKIGAQNYFEIGTWRGESVANVASVVPECTTLNLSREEIIALTHSEEYADLHGFFSKNLPNVKQIHGNSLHFDFAPYEKKFDLVFIDGDHHYESVKSDTAAAFKLLKDENSILVWHDYGFDPESIRWSVLRGILEGMPTEEHHRLFHISNTMCAVYLPDSLTNTIHPTVLRPHEKPTHYFEVNIKAKKVIG